jgi:hypothetical protein
VVVTARFKALSEEKYRNHSSHSLLLSEVVTRVKAVWTPATLQGILSVPVSAVSDIFYSEECTAEEDELCDDWSDSEWSSVFAEYYNYVYDETDDDEINDEIPLWEFPRTLPASIFKNNGYCEDGNGPSFTGKPSGEYYISFAAHCDDYSVTLPTTGTVFGCGKAEYIPCLADCRDCGRRAGGSGSGGGARRNLRQLPSPKRPGELISFLLDIRRGIKNHSIVNYSLPLSYTRLL